VATRGPLWLIAGGSGIVPLMAMLRHRARRKVHGAALMVSSSRTLEDCIFCEELAMLERDDPDLRLVSTLTRERRQAWSGRQGRVDKALLDEVGFPPEQNPKIYVCGPSSFVEDVSRFLVELGHDPLAVRTERFGPSGT